MNGIRGALVDAVIAALPIAIVFFSGWAYLSSYLGEFGVDATEVTVPLSTVLVYAFIPLESPRVLIFLMICLVVTILIAYGGISGTNEEGVNPFVISLSFIALVLFLFIIKSAAVGEARAMANFVWTGDKAQSVPVLITPHAEEPYREFEQCRERRGLRQIIGFPDRMYVLCRDTDLPCLRGRMFVVSSAGAVIYSALQNHSFNEGEEGCEK
ncbi:hypothetical protein NKJ26_27775 [Mesorhizobium sp. M0152]|uniref:hypothetical protein n=1 Tax=Mesorhizobium sp. M0152 TaxID=2956898 RepID=UPI00333D35C1